MPETSELLQEDQPQITLTVNGTGFKVPIPFAATGGVTERMARQLNSAFFRRLHSRIDRAMVICKDQDLLPGIVADHYRELLKTMR